MVIPDALPAMSANSGETEAERSTSDALEARPGPSPETSMTAAPSFTYADFAAALKDALRDYHSPDLLARNCANSSSPSAWTAISPSPTPISG